MKKDLILIGGGGHCRSCIDVIEIEGIYKISGIVDRSTKLGQKIQGYEIIGTDEDLPKFVRSFKNYLITIGQIKSSTLRKKLFKQLTGMGAVFPSIISPLAYVSKDAQIFPGTIIMHRAVVNSKARIGKNCIINTGAIIEHDAQIADHCHISTGAIVNGGGTIGEGTFLGSNAVCRENVNIGNHCVVGMGAKVLKDCKANSKVL